MQSKEIAAHHLLTLFENPYTDGYSPQHTKRLQAFISDFIRDPEAPITIGSVPDGVCIDCPHNPEGKGNRRIYTHCDLNRLRQYDHIIQKHLREFFRQRGVNIDQQELTVGAFDDPQLLPEITWYLAQQLDYVDFAIDFIDDFSSAR